MPTKAKLTDLQLVLLSNAASRADGMLLPPPDRARARGKTLEKTLGKLLRLGLVEEAPAVSSEQAWREEDGRRVGLRIAAAGRAALGLAEETETPAPDAEAGGDAERASGTEETGEAEAGAASETTHCPPPPLPPGMKPGTKQLRLVGYLSRPAGISVAELSGLLGWRPHTVRAALTGLRKKGYAVTNRKNDEGVALFTATPPAPAASDAA